MTEQAAVSARTAASKYARLVALAALVGIPAALVAAVFLAIVHEVEHWVWHELPEALGYDEAPWWLVIVLPMVGGVIVWAARRTLPGDGGHSPLDGLGTEPTPYQYAPSIILAAIGTLAFGAVLGPEAPLIALGSAVGMLVNRFVTLDPQGRAVVATAGSFSAISALFGGPMVAGVLLLESGVGLGAAVLPMLLPGLVSAAVGYLLFVGLGDWGGINETALAVPDLPAYDGTRIVDLLIAVLVGVATALLITQVRRLARAIDKVAVAPGRMLVTLVAAGLVVGLLAVVTDLLGGDIDEVLFSGQSAVPIVIQDGALLLVVVIAAKSIGYAVCLGAGFRGGPVFPAIFLGVAVATLAVDLFGLSPTWAVAVGAAAGTTAGTGLLFSALLFCLLLVGDPGLDAVPAAVFAAAAAWVTSAAVSGRLPGSTPAAAEATEQH